MLGLGLAFSHAPAMFCRAELWPVAYATIPQAMRESQPPSAKLETMEVIRGYIERIRRAYATLGTQIRSHRPDALIFIGDDQEDMFDARNSPALCIFTGEKVWGTSAPRYMKVPREAARVEIPVHAVLAQHLRAGLLHRGAQLKNLFTFDSDTLRGGTGELRSWISAAGRASGRPPSSITCRPTT